MQHVICKVTVKTPEPFTSHLFNSFFKDFYRQNLDDFIKQDAHFELNVPTDKVLTDIQMSLLSCSIFYLVV